MSLCWIYRKNRTWSSRIPRTYLDRVDIITGTLGKALGGAMGGYTTGKKEVIDMLRQKSRPYLILKLIGAFHRWSSKQGIRNLEFESTELRDRLEENTKYFKDADRRSWIRYQTWETHRSYPSCSTMQRCRKNSQMHCCREGVYAIGFFYPVVPKGAGANSYADLSGTHKSRFGQSS